jgi:septal ring factor EnvC (AmiA/AmiB activator)
MQEMVVSAMTGGAIIDAALARFVAAVEKVELAVMKRRENERLRADLEDELAAAQDDRQRLATELASLAAQNARLDAAATDIERRLEAAMGEIRALLAALEPPDAGKT